MVQMNPNVKLMLISGIIALTSFEGYSQSNVVFYGSGSNTLNVAFADVTLSAAAKSAITIDLQLCLNEWGQSAEIRIAEHDGYAGYFYNPNTSPHYRDGVDFPEQMVKGLADDTILLISKKLSDAYRNAFVFEIINSNIVSDAYQFVKFISSTNFLSITPLQIVI